MGVGLLCEPARDVDAQRAALAVVDVDEKGLVGHGFLPIVMQCCGATSMVAFRFVRSLT
jgi:hypothetical protein